MKKARTFRNRMIVFAAIVLVVVAFVLIYVFGGKGASVVPVYANVSANVNDTGSSCTFNVLWNDDVNVSGYIFGSNSTGTFANDTWAPFPRFFNSTSALSSATKTLNKASVMTVQWRIWCNDTKGNWGSTDLRTVVADSNKVLLRTSMGNITIELYDDTSITTSNFKNLTRRGIYDNTIFHRVVSDFVVQGGDPTGTGSGDPSISQIPDELPNRHSNTKGAVAMAKTAEPNSATSQFFINLNDRNSASLDANYTVFGRVIAGMDVVDAIGLVQTNTNQRPTQEIRLIKAELVG